MRATRSPKRHCAATCPSSSDHLAGPAGKALDADLRNRITTLQATGSPAIAVAVRPMVPADRPRLEVMYADFEPLRAAQGLPPGPDRLNDWLDRVTATGHHIVATTTSDAIIGHVMLVPLETGTVELASFVHQSARDRGLGSALARAAVQLARELGYHRVWLSVEPSNRAAVRSYARAGFTRVPGSAWAPELEMAVDLQPALARTPAAAARPSA